MRIDDFCRTIDQIAYLVIVSLAVQLLADFFLTPAPRTFNVAGLRASGFGFAIDFLAVYLVARALARPALAVSLLVIFFSIDPIARISNAAVESIPYVDPKTLQPLLSRLILSLALTAWAFVVIFRAIRVAAGTNTRRLLVAYLLYLAVAIIPGFLPEERLWRTLEDHESESSTVLSRPRAVTWEEAEDVFNAQAGLVRSQDSRLLPGRKGVVDLYFVGFASYAGQDVFFKEVTYAKDLFDRRFDTLGRSVLLVNNPQTKHTLPVASVTNLRTTLVDVGRKMNRNEDVLFLLLASHGLREHKLSVRNGSLPLRELTPAMLSDALDDARIQWRVIVVDACYSGGFIEPLKNDNSMIITSASATHTSYGCGDEDEMTYFGRAFLRHGLAWKLSFAESFEEAAKLIHRWETTEGGSHAEPQMFIGSVMRDKAKVLEGRLKTNSIAPGNRAPSERAS